MKILDAALTAHWAIEEHALDLVLKIASREHEVTPEALEAYRAKALERAERATTRDGVAILNVEGPPFKKANLMVEFSGATSYQILRRDLDVALNDGNVRAILLNVDSPDRAIDFGDTLARGQVVLESLKGRAAAIDEGRKFFKGLDVIGVDQTERMQQLYNGWLKALGVEGADLDMGGFLQMIRQSRTAGATLNDRFLTLIAPQLAQDIGDARLGTSLASASSQLIAGRSTKESQALQQKYGLRDADGEYVDKRGLQNDPFEHLMKTVLPALQKRGVDINDNNALADLFANLFSNRTVSDVFTKMATQREQILAKIANYEKAPGLAGADRLLAQDPTTAFGALTAQTTNLVNALTNPLVPAATDALNGRAKGIGALAQSLTGNKEIAAIAGLGTKAAVTGGSAWLSWRGAKAAGEWRGSSVGGSAAKAAPLPFEAATKAAPSMLASIGKTLGLGVAALGVNAVTKSATGRDPLAEATSLIDRVKGGSLTSEDRSNIVASQNALRKALGLENFFARIEGRTGPKPYDGEYGRDFTLESKGGFSRAGTNTPPSRVGYMSNWNAKQVAPGPLGQSTDIAKQFDEQISRMEEAGRQSGLKFSSALSTELAKPRRRRQRSRSASNPRSRLPPPPSSAFG